MLIAEFETNTTRVQFDEQGIMHVQFKAGEDVVLKDVLDMYEWKSEKLDGAKHYTVTTPEYGSTVDPEVRNWAQSPERAARIGADAFVVITLAHKLLANFYIKYNKPQHPTKVFSDNDTAMKWILEMKEAQA